MSLILKQTHINLLRAIRSPHSTSQQLGDALRAYLLARKPPHKPMEVMTRAEYQALCDRSRKRKPRRKKNGQDSIRFVYETIESKLVEEREHSPILDEQNQGDLDWIDALARRQNEQCEEWENYDRPW